jgi:signal transduction histidine kinase
MRKRHGGAFEVGTESASDSLRTPVCKSFDRELPMLPEQSEASIREVRRQEILEREILQIADREKQHIARELHDGLCQSLAGIAALTSALSRSLAEDGQSGPAAAADEIARLLNEAIGEARDVAHGIGLIGRNGRGLAGELESLARNICRTRRASCAFAGNLHAPGLRDEAQTHLLRIAQEAVRNALAHGRAKEIDICLERLDGSGLLSIRDNGTGLADDYRNRGGIGLNTMDYRARAIGGSLAVTRRPEGGTAVACAFPLPQMPNPREGHGNARL